MCPRPCPDALEALGSTRKPADSDFRVAWYHPSGQAEITHLAAPEGRGSAIGRSTAAKQREFWRSAGTILRLPSPRSSDGLPGFKGAEKLPA
jgi:hypothetical protein